MDGTLDAWDILVQQDIPVLSAKVYTYEYTRTTWTISWGNFRKQDTNLHFSGVRRSSDLH